MLIEVFFFLVTLGVSHIIHIKIEDSLIANPFTLMHFSEESQVFANSNVTCHINLIFKDHICAEIAC